jgi:hypothetical protein
MSFLGDVFGGLGRAVTGGISGLFSGGPIGAIAGAGGGLLGSVLGGGNPVTGALGGALGGLGGQSLGMDPAQIAALTGLGSTLLSEQAAARKSLEDQLNYRNQLGQRGLSMAEGAYADKEPLRQAGMGAVTGYLGGNPYGIFAPTDPNNPGNLTPEPFQSTFSRQQGFTPGMGMPTIPGSQPLPGGVVSALPGANPAQVAQGAQAAGQAIKSGDMQAALGGLGQMVGGIGMPTQTSRDAYNLPASLGGLQRAPAPSSSPSPATLAASNAGNNPYDRLRQAQTQQDPGGMFGFIAQQPRLVEALRRSTS